MRSSIVGVIDRYPAITGDSAGTYKAGVGFVRQLKVSACLQALYRRVMDGDPRICALGVREVSSISAVVDRDPTPLGRQT